MRFLLITYLLLVAGCTASRSFDISVKNDTSQPLTLGLVKYGPPLETHWASPEDIAINSPGRQDVRWGGVLPVDKTAEIHQSGQFAHGAAGFLRIYTGEHALSELLAMGRRNTDRVDLPLEQGKNEFVVEIKNGKLSATRLTGRQKILP